MTPEPTDGRLRFVAQLDSIVPYEPGAPIEHVMRRFGLNEVVKLASNEFPLPPFDEVKAAITSALDDLNRYPDGSALNLREALAARYGRTIEQTVVGNGSCELLLLLGSVLLEPGDEVVFADPSFLVYSDICLQHRARAVAVPTRNYAHDLEAMLAAISDRTKMVVVCNPNNPTGTYLPADAIDEFVGRVPGHVLVVLDEAYNEFVDREDWQETLPIQRRHENVMILRTFSKIYGLCGLRVGYGLCSPAVSAAIDKLRQPFNVNHLAQVAALEALRHDDLMLARRAENADRRAYLERKLAAMGRAYVPSEANFMLVGIEDLCHPQERVCGALMALGSIVRDGNALGCPGWARVSIGTMEELDFFLEHLRSLHPDAEARREESI